MCVPIGKLVPKSPSMPFLGKNREIGNFFKFSNYFDIDQLAV